MVLVDSLDASDDVSEGMLACLKHAHNVCRMLSMTALLVTILLVLIPWCLARSRKSMAFMCMPMCAYTGVYEFVFVHGYGYGCEDEYRCRCGAGKCACLCR